MATDWGYPENTSQSLRRIANLLDEMAESTVDNADMTIRMEEDF